MTWIPGHVIGHQVEDNASHDHHLTLCAKPKKRNVHFYTKSCMADSIAHGILDETEDHRNIKFVLMGWPGPLGANTVPNNLVKLLLEKAKTNGSLNTSNTVPCSWCDDMHSRQYIRSEDD